MLAADKGMPEISRRIVRITQDFLGGFCKIAVVHGRFSLTWAMFDIYYIIIYI
jgi:hypothetical protein